MMMGLANQDGGFTGTLFMPHHATENAPGFDTVKERADVERFFQDHFRDALPMVPDLVDQYLRNPQSSLVIIRCNPWQVNGKVALIGDAAHAIVPFYGEGMNAGYEDCKVLNDLLNELGDPHEQYAVDDVVQFPTPDGLGSYAGAVREVRADGAVLFDFNHPLAGQAVRFEVELIGVL